MAGDTPIRITFVSDSDQKLDEGIHQTLGNYHLRFDPPHSPSGQHHIHVALRKGNKKLFAVNKDGTAHDQSHGVQLPREVRDHLRSIRPDWIIPDLLESISAPKLIAESMDDDWPHKII
jgi:hypothetical protein